MILRILSTYQFVENGVNGLTIMKFHFLAHVLKGKRIELLLTDPPYGIDYVASKAGFNESTKEHEDIANDGFQSDEEYARFTEGWLRPIIPCLSEKNASYIFNADKMIFALRDGMLRA